jgi:hypothetical protein
MSRFSRTNNFSSKTFLVKTPSVNIKPTVQEIQVEHVIEEKQVVEELPVEQVLEETLSVEEEPDIKLEEIYQNTTAQEIIEPVENPQQIELKKIKSKEKFKLLVEEIILNAKKAKIDGWVV